MDRFAYPVQTDSLAGGLLADLNGAEDAISLGAPVSYLIDKAAQLVMPGPVITKGETASRR